MADPGFPRGRAPIRQGGMGGANLLFGILFAKNCMKMKKNAVRGDAHPSRLPRFATANSALIDFGQIVCNFSLHAPFVTVIYKHFFEHV